MNLQPFKENDSRLSLGVRWIGFVIIFLGAMLELQAVPDFTFKPINFTTFKPSNFNAFKSSPPFKPFHFTSFKSPEHSSKESEPENESTSLKPKKKISNIPQKTAKECHACLAPIQRDLSKFISKAQCYECLTSACQDSTKNKKNETYGWCKEALAPLLKEIKEISET